MSGRIIQESKAEGFGARRSYAHRFTLGNIHCISVKQLGRTLKAPAIETVWGSE
jgi:hypothetical protein